MDESDGFSDTGIEEGEGDSEGVVYEDSVTEVVDLDGEGTESGERAHTVTRTQ